MAIAMAVALFALILVRLQVLGGQAKVMGCGLAMFGWIFCAVGAFQLISGRDDDHGGIGLLGMLFVVVIGLALSVVGFVAVL